MNAEMTIVGGAVFITATLPSDACASNIVGALARRTQTILRVVGPEGNTVVEHNLGNSLLDRKPEPPLTPEEEADNARYVDMRCSEF